MKTSSQLLCRRNLRRTGQRGQTLVEYALILAFIAVVAIGVLMALGSTTRSAYAGVSVHLATAQAGGASGGTAH
jgi:Flp pilus assembly pilin Flp